MLKALLLIIYVPCTVMMIVLVLLHSGRGGGLSDMFGGAGSTALGSTAAERNLNRITVVFATIFAFLTVAIGMMMD
ncbi:MAG: preprotein translocase subunit SecG [Acidimicrobiia bacterium]